jgi:hypothetical protein
MITWTQLYTRAADITGVSSTVSSSNLTNIKQDINQGLRLFKNAARRYWTRVEKSTGLVAGQQYYQLPPDAVRVTQIRVVSNGLFVPVTQVSSEERWNRLNVIPAATISLPTHFFVKGNNEIGLWPTPSQTVSNGLLISYEPRLVDMSVEDVTGASANVTNASTAVTFSTTPAKANMVGQWFQVTDGSDGNWYQISIFNSTSSLTLGNDYQGLTGTGLSFVIGQAPDIPEDYHMALVYYAAYQYFLKRKDANTAETYNSLFNDLLNQYKETYAAKTTGVVQNNHASQEFNVFQIPPNPIT